MQAVEESEPLSAPSIRHEQISSTPMAFVCFRVAFSWSRSPIILSLVFSLSLLRLSRELSSFSVALLSSGSQFVHALSRPLLSRSIGVVFSQLCKCLKPIIISAPPIPQWTAATRTDKAPIIRLFGVLNKATVFWFMFMHLSPISMSKHHRIFTKVNSKHPNKHSMYRLHRIQSFSLLYRFWCFFSLLSC